MDLLGHFRVVDLSDEIAGPYCTRLLADAGADVIRVEPRAGDPLRRWSATGADLGDRDGVLFRFLHHGKRSVAGEPEDPHVEDLLASADLVVESLAPGRLDVAGLLARDPGLVVLSISPYGRGGPLDAHPATEFTIQAECGSIGTRGLPGREPFQAGGRITEWVAGTFAAVGALAALHRARRTGHGEHVDFSMLEVMTIAGTNYTDLLFQVLGLEPTGGLPQTVETPSIEPTLDGYVGFCTNSRQQFSDFLLLIERPDLRDDEQLAQVAGRMARFEEWNRIVHAYTTRHTTAEIIERASLLRIPVAPVLSAAEVPHHEQIVARGALRPDPEGQFLMPRPPYRIDDQDPPPPRPAPAVGEHTGRIESRAPARREPEGPPGLPLEGVRVVDMTAWWAGPSATQMLALLGADVIHLESTHRPDGMRMVGGMLAGRYPEWWEASHFFLGTNTNKRGITLDLRHPRGLELARELIARSDALVENMSPRVLDQFGLTWPSIHARNPRTILVRMPAFGLTGPWRDNTGFAQTMEQITGLAWVTGHQDDQPRIQRGPCDPLAGMHAAFALLLALERRDRTGLGCHVECTMVEGALNAAAEQIAEATAYGRVMEREGNRSPTAAPQGLYPCAGSEPGLEQWLALSVRTDAQWHALREVLGDPPWARAPELDTLAGRRRHHDAIDAELRSFFLAQDREEIAERLAKAGVPAVPLRDPRLAHRHPQMAARGFFEPFEHPVVGRHTVPSAPFRYRSVKRWIRHPAPTLGEHNREVLGGLLGLSEAELAELEAEGVIGTRMAGL